MSALHRNALLPDDEATCIRCAVPVELPADYCACCEADNEYEQRNRAALRKAQGLAEASPNGGEQ